MYEPIGTVYATNSSEFDGLDSHGYDFYHIRIMKVPGRVLVAADTKFKF